MPFRIRTVLVASDLSEASDGVLRSAADLAALADGELHVVHAVEEAADEGGPRAEELRRVAERALRARLRAVVDSIIEVASTRVAPGRADEVILQRAADAGADLIVVGPHRERENGRRELGTTADRLVRTSEVPCLIVRDPIALPLRRLLVPSDLSDAACGALELGLIWAAALRVPTRSGGRTTVEVLHVIPPAEPGGVPADRDELEVRLREHLDEACERAGCAAPLDLSRKLIEGGKVPDEILRYARESQADLLVMGTHGETAQSREAIGGASSTVARRTECPLLLVPPRLWKTRRAREDAAQGLRPNG